MFLVYEGLGPTLALGHWVSRFAEARQLESAAMSERDVQGYRRLLAASHDAVDGVPR